MASKKKIPCRVCGKMFEPCGYCQSHSDTFRWRNFACSIACATKYLEDTEKFRASKNSAVKENKAEKVIDNNINETAENNVVDNAIEKALSRNKRKRNTVTEEQVVVAEEDTIAVNNEISLDEVAENAINTAE